MSDTAADVAEKTNYWLRTGVVLNVCVKEALLDILHDLTTNGLPADEKQAYQRLIVFRQNEEKNLKGVLKPVQWDKIAHCCDGTCQNPCQKSGKTNTKELDITAIVVLIINLTTLLPPLGSRGWRQAKPQRGDGSKAANVLLARNTRNKLNHGSIDDIKDKDQFDEQWDSIEIIIIGLGYKNMQLFHDLKEASLDPYVHEQINILGDKYEQVLANDTVTQSDLQKMKKEIDSLNQTVKDLENKLDEKVNKTELNDLLGMQTNAKEKLISIEINIQTVNQNTNISNTFMDKVEIHHGISLSEQMIRSLIEASTATLETQEDGKGLALTEGLISTSLELKRATRERYSVSEPRKEIFLNLNRKICLEPGTSLLRMVQDQISEQRSASAGNFLLEDYDEIIRTPKENVIIIGCPGSGKTSLIDTLLKKWANDEIWSAKDDISFDFVFVIYFRQLNQFVEQPGITAKSILNHFYPDICFENIRKQIRNEKVNCLLVMDGLDEFSENLKGRNIPYLARAVGDLLSPFNPKLPFQRIVTARPKCLDDLKMVFCNSFSDLQVRPKDEAVVSTLQLLGFDYDGVNSYIKESISLDDPLQVEILNHAKKNEKLFDMMTIPFYCRGICDLIKYNALSVEEIPLSYTELFVKLLFLHLWKNGSYGTTNLSEVCKDDDFKELCINLSSLAYNHKMKGIIIFKANEIELPCKMDMEILLKSGLIIMLEDESTSFTCYQFLHYSYQEFLEALHCFHTGKISDDENTRSTIADLMREKSQGFANMFNGKELLLDVLRSSESKPIHLSVFYMKLLYEHRLCEVIPDDLKPIHLCFDNQRFYDSYYNRNEAEIIYFYQNSFKYLSQQARDLMRKKDASGELKLTRLA